jgi:hypothetical protein
MLSYTLEADPVSTFGFKIEVGAEGKRVNPMGLQSASRQDLVHCCRKNI